MQNIKFTPTHEWVKEDMQEAIIGITDHAQQLLGDIVFIELPEIGAEVSAGEEIGVIESVKAAADLYSPISGKIIAINHEAINNPALINNDALGEGWLAKIQPSNREEFQSLLDMNQYNAILAREQ
jgi:glycine cleavage system H protein